jgi:hypothetical protein
MMCFGNLDGARVWRMWRIDGGFGTALAGCLLDVTAVVVLGKRVGISCVPKCLGDIASMLLAVSFGDLFLFWDITYGRGRKEVGGIGLDGHVFFTAKEMKKQGSVTWNEAWMAIYWSHYLGAFREPSACTSHTVLRTCRGSSSIVLGDATPLRGLRKELTMYGILRFWRRVF